MIEMKLRNPNKDDAYMQTRSDIFIIGGGINGTAIAADAASRGLTVTLCEKNDLASATSSRADNAFNMTRRASSV